VWSSLGKRPSTLMTTVPLSKCWQGFVDFQAGAAYSSYKIMSDVDVFVLIINLFSRRLPVL